MQSYEQAYAYIAALTQCDPATVTVDFRAIHDQDKGVPAKPMRGTLPNLWSALCEWNNAGYGIFACVSDMDGEGHHDVNVRATRVAVIDLDNASATANFDRASQWSPSPQFGVQSSPGKYHVYWSVPYYADLDHYRLRQRKLRQLFDGDKKIIDPARVMRVPGTIHCKGEPHLVTCFAMAGYGAVTSHEAIDGALVHVNVIDGATGVRRDLGDPELAAPALNWIEYALANTDPNDLDRGEWISFSCAIKQAGWTLTDPDTLFAMWSDWCAKYTVIDPSRGINGNDPAENLKQWNSIRNTELGWHSLVRRVPSIGATGMFGGIDRTGMLPTAASANTNAAPSTPDMPVPQPPAMDCSGEFISHMEARDYFKDCMFITNLGLILTGKGRFLNSTKFNALYGGKKFLIDSVGKTTPEPWVAATRSTQWTIPKVDHIRFLPSEAYHAIITDELGRDGVNTYKPINIRRTKGNPAPFLNHIAALLPNAGDQKILLDYLAHNVKYPGVKIPWAPVIQSAEGAGKGILKAIMMHCMGRVYCYFPNAKELTESGSQFNAWMRNKLFILADEIKVDDRRDLIEVLKPMISEELIEIQSKGVDQDIEDNFSNWMFFTNWKDAVPVNKNGRRFSIMYSPLQTESDMLARGMDGAYFQALYAWIRADGAAVVADYLFDYPIECRSIPYRAPQTSSTVEAITVSRSPVERTIFEALEDNLQGFRGGWISSIAVTKRLKLSGAVRGTISPEIIGQIVESMGYVRCGRADRPYFHEDADSRAHLWHFGSVAPVAAYGTAQGYGI